MKPLKRREDLIGIFHIKTTAIISEKETESAPEGEEASKPPKKTKKQRQTQSQSINVFWKFRREVKDACNFVDSAWGK